MKVLKVDPVRCTAGELEPAVAWLRGGGIVAFPTETFYGLAVDPRSAPAVSSLFDLKGRPEALALPLIAPSMTAVEALGGPLSSLTRRLAATFWPGPLSLIVDVRAPLAPGVAANATVAVRVPSHPVARQLTVAWSAPLTATSANLTGHPPARTVDELGALVNDARVFVVDGGATAGGRPSTIVDARNEPPVLVREGAVPWSRVLKFRN